MINTHFDDDSPSAKFGPAIVDTDLQIDLFYPSASRTNAENMIYQTKAALGRRGRITSDIRLDNTIGREVYHIIFKLSDYII